jgi:cell division protein ZapA
MEHESLIVKILSKEYQISCPNGTETELQAAAAYLDEKMNEIRNNGRIISFEGMLMTAAINLAHEVVQQNIKQASDNKNLVNNLNLLEKKLNHVLQKPVSSNKLKFEYNNNEC